MLSRQRLLVLSLGPLVCGTLIATLLLVAATSHSESQHDRFRRFGTLESEHNTLAGSDRHTDAPTDLDNRTNGSSARGPEFGAITADPAVPLH